MLRTKKLFRDKVSNKKEKYYRVSLETHNFKKKNLIMNLNLTRRFHYSFISISGDRYELERFLSFFSLIYMILNRTTSEFYIGSTSHLKKRIQKYFRIVS